MQRCRDFWIRNDANALRTATLYVNRMPHLVRTHKSVVTAEPHCFVCMTYITAGVIPYLLGICISRICIISYHVLEK